MKKNITKQLGFWSSVFIAVLGVIYIIVLVIYFSTEGFAFPPNQTVQLFGGIITFLTVPGLLVQFTAIRYAKDWENKILGSLGITFITLFAATVSINRFVQLTVIQQSAQDAASQDLARFLPYATGSVMFALEMLGWGFFSSLAALSVAPLFYGSRITTSIRWLFVVYALFSFTSVIGYSTESPISAAAFIAWGPVLLALAVMLAIYFRKENKLFLTDDDGIVRSTYKVCNQHCSAMNRNAGEPDRMLGAQIPVIQAKNLARRRNYCQ